MADDDVIKIRVTQRFRMEPGVVHQPIVLINDDGQMRVLNPGTPITIPVEDGEPVIEQTIEKAKP